MNIKIYGSRGSIPFCSGTGSKYGGNTSCIKTYAGGHTIILDCGSGLMQFMKEIKQSGIPMRFDILISHLHIDHIIGLSMFSPLWDKKSDIRIFTKSRDGRPLAQQVLGMFKPPYWPVDLTQMNCAEIIEIKNDVPFKLNRHIKVTPFAANHPDDTTAFRIDDGESNKSVVHMLDHGTEDDPAEYGKTVCLCKNADAIIYDGAYSPEDQEKRKTYGHSSYADGIALAEETGCGRMIFCHMDQKYSDDELDGFFGIIRSESEKYLIAYDGMEVFL